MSGAHDCGVYEIVNTATGGQYVGGTANFRLRWNRHRSDLRRGISNHPRLQRAWDDSGQGAFEFRKLLVCGRGHLRDYEQRCIDGLRPAYNVQPNALSAVGVRRAPDVCARMSVGKLGNINALGYKHPSRFGVAISARQRGKECSLKTREKIGAAVSAAAAKKRGAQ